MWLRPKRTKFKKYHKGRNSTNIRENQILKNEFSYGIIALEGGRLSEKVIKSLDESIKKKLKQDTNYSNYGLRVYPTFPVTSKPIEVRMGKGKGNVDYWAGRVKRGGIILEWNSSNEKYAKKIFNLINSKLGIKTKFISSCPLGAPAGVRGAGI